MHFNNQISVTILAALAAVGVSAQGAHVERDNYYGPPPASSTASSSVITTSSTAPPTYSTPSNVGPIGGTSTTATSSTTPSPSIGGPTIGGPTGGCSMSATTVYVTVTVSSPGGPATPCTPVTVTEGGIGGHSSKKCDHKGGKDSDCGGHKTYHHKPSGASGFSTAPYPGPSDVSPTDTQPPNEYQTPSDNYSPPAPTSTEGGNSYGYKPPTNYN